MKIDSTWTSILRQIDVDLMYAALMYAANMLCTEIYFWKECVCLAIKIKC